MTTTYLSHYAKKALCVPTTRELYILPNLGDVAPALLEDALHPEPLAGANAFNRMTPRRRDESEFYMAVERRLDEVTAVAEGSINGHRADKRELASQYADLRGNRGAGILVPLVPDFIAVCERRAAAYESCGQIAVMERQRRQVAAAGPGCGMSWVQWQYDHVDAHRSLMAAWLGLAAYLAARLDAMGRVLQSAAAADSVPAR